MSDQSQGNNNQQAIVYALIAIAVLLLAIVGFMVYQRMTAIPSPTATVPSSSAPAGASSSSGAMSSTSVAPAAFDPKTATKLPAGMTPDQAMAAYTKAVVGAKWADAYALLPLAQKQSYQSAESMGSQLAPYNISGFKVGKSTTSGSDLTIVGEEDTPQMNIAYTWTFTKVGDTWYVKSRTMGGSVSP